MDSPHTVFGTVKNSLDFCVGPKMSMCYLHKMNGLNCVENNMYAWN